MSISSNNDDEELELAVQVELENQAREEAQDMLLYEPLQPDTRRQTTCMIADTRTIALIASKKNFNPDKERLLIEKARKTVCKCHHFTGTEICLYRNCRHFAEVHYKGV